MSHFPVAIFHEPNDDIEEILAPYAEDVDENSPYAIQDGEYWINPNAKWDWWEVGGRWSGFLKLKNSTKCNSAPASECVFGIDPKEEIATEYASPVPYAYISHDREWNEPGSMGWFGLDDSTPEGRSKYKEAWEAELKYATENSLTITIVDCHI